MRSIVTADIGGTHARFALATLDGGRVAAVESAVTLRTRDYANVVGAWREFGRRMERDVPAELAIALAGPVNGEQLKLTNNPWVIHGPELASEVGLEHLTIVNDFGAVANAVSELGADSYRHLTGPEVELPKTGVTTIVGPGTGLGVAAVLRRSDGESEIITTEGGHISFAPVDEFEDKLLAKLRRRYGRVSAERLVSGPGLFPIYETVCEDEGSPADLDEGSVWAEALSGGDPAAVKALDRFCCCLGCVAGDLALAQGASGVVIGGGLGLRLSGHLGRSGFADRFVAKGRFEPYMAQVPVKVMMHPDAGLFGAAVAFLKEHGDGSFAAVA